MGCELLGIEYRPHVHGGLLRLYIDKPGGVMIDDCERVSHQVSGVLDVEDVVPGKYTLEVSSPGMDRPLFKPEQYPPYVGETVRVTTSVAIDGRRKFRGELKRVQETKVVVEVDGAEFEIPFTAITKARLVPDFDAALSGGADSDE
ncbi:MAG: ribosome maturation factor RimP [Gammaproteobacteria bacterium]|nr:ribosome maturation factor RimP [Gammaproteobacteria bacterium]